MPVLVTCKFDKYLIKGDWEKLETSFSFTAQGHVTPVTGQIRLEFEPVQDFMPVLVTSKADEDWIHSNREKVETSFSPL